MSTIPTTTTYSLDRTSGPASEPVTTAEARDQCEIAATVTAHDTKLDRFIAAAREQVETDTEYVCITQTYTLSFSAFPCEDTIDLPVRPVASISSITYFDSNNTQQTLATTVYGLDAARRVVHLKYDQEWPDITEQHNGIVITFVAGFGTASNVPSLIKQAMLLQVEKWFVHRGDETGGKAVQMYDIAYEALISRILRTSYP